MRKSYRLNDEMSSDALQNEYDMTTMMIPPDRIPRGIEVEENRIFFYCPIGDYEALELNRTIRRLDVEMQYLSHRLNCDPVPIHMHIHSPGGSLFAGLSVYDTIKNCKSSVHTYIDGSAASAATLISLAGTKKLMSKNSFMLIHQQHIDWTGKLDDFIDEIENQKSITEKIKGIYLEHTSMSEETLEELLTHELWLDSERCLELGLVDSVEG